MKAQWFVLLNLTFFSLTATAFPHASLNQLTQQSDPNCSQSGSDNGLSSLIQQVNIVARKGSDGNYYDGRKPLSKVTASELGITEEARTRLYKNVGELFCPNLSDASQGTGFLVGDGSQILTAAHVLQEDSGVDRRQLENCFWELKGKPARRIMLDIGSNSYKPFTRRTKQEFFKDLALVRLKERVPDAKSFRIDNSGVPLRVGDEVIMVSAFQERMPSLHLKKELIPVGNGVSAVHLYSTDLVVEKCPAIVVGETSEFVTTSGLYTECSGTHGTSGAPVFYARNGELIIKAVATISGKDSADNTPFTMDKDARSGRSFTYSIQISRDIADQIETFEAENEKKRTASDDSRIRQSNSFREKGL